jgi:hypothetical protein
MATASSPQTPPDCVWNNMRRLLAKITGSPAQTARALEAKARMVPFILLSGTAVSRSLHGDEVDFFEAFASEVKQFLQAQPHPIEAAS